MIATTCSPILFGLRPPFDTLLGGGGVPPVMRGLHPAPFAIYVISGVTKDSAGAALAGCTVDLFRTVGDVFVSSTVSDGSGNYSFTAGPAQFFYVVAYKAGAPDVAGTTVNTLVAA